MVPSETAWPLTTLGICADRPSFLDQMLSSAPQLTILSRVPDKNPSPGQGSGLFCGQCRACNRPVDQKARHLGGAGSPSEVPWD